MDTTVTIAGNLTEDPTLRYTPSGVAVANFTVADTPRVKGADGTWQDAETTFWSCTVWRGPAENAAESLVKGTRVVVVGRVRTQRWDDKATGDKRSRVVVEVEEIGTSIRFATAKVTRSARAAGASSPDSGGATDPWQQAPDPWGGN
jgi:single-strand DNA-binding protein